MIVRVGQTICPTNWMTAQETIGRWVGEGQRAPDPLLFALERGKVFSYGEAHLESCDGRRALSAKYYFTDVLVELSESDGTIFMLRWGQ